MVQRALFSVRVTLLSYFLYIRMFIDYWFNRNSFHLFYLKIYILQYNREFTTASAYKYLNRFKRSALGRIVMFAKRAL